MCVCVCVCVCPSRSVSTNNFLGFLLAIYTECYEDQGLVQNSILSVTKLMVSTNGLRNSWLVQMCYLMCYLFMCVVPMKTDTY